MNDRTQRNENGNSFKNPAGNADGAGPAGRSAASSRAPEQTFEEVRYLKQLIDDQVPVVVKLRDNSEVSGVIEYYDLSFIRLTRDDAPNLFIYKHEIKYIREA